MNKFKTTSRISKILFYVLYFWTIITAMLGEVNGVGHVLRDTNIVRYVLLAVLCLINMISLNKKQLFISFLLLVFGLYTDIVGGGGFFLVPCLFIVACKTIDLDKLMKYDIWIKLGLLILVAVLYLVGMTTVNLQYRDGIVRHSMGFANPNTFGSYILSIVMEWLYLRRSKLNIFDFLISIVAIFIIDYFSSSRTSMLCLIAFIALLVFNRRRIKKISYKKQSKILEFLVDNSFIICAILSILVSMAYIDNSQSMGWINSATTGRVKTAAVQIENNGVAFFGPNNSGVLEYIEERNITIDNLYVHTLLLYGVFTLVVLCFGMRKIMIFTRNEDIYILRYIILIFIISCLAEKFGFRIQTDFFILFFSYMIYGVPTDSLEKDKVGIKEKNND